MIRYKRSIEATLLTWMIFLLLGGPIIAIAVSNRWDITGTFIMLAISELPMLYIFPKGSQEIKIDKNGVTIGWRFVKFRIILWPEVKEIGIAYSYTGYSKTKKFIYISKRPVKHEERFSILRVKDYKNFITMENRGNIINVIKEYSNLPFEPLPSAENQLRRP